MNAAELIADLARLGIRLEADGDRLRYYPRSAATPDVLDRLKAHKVALLATLQPTPDNRRESPAESAKAAKPVCRCGSTAWVDFPIHDGRTVRRDCARCKRFIDFPIWYGTDTGHKDQQ